MITNHPNTTDATFTNTSSKCAYPIGLATYKKFDSNIDNQELVDYGLAIIGPNTSVTLTVVNPPCAYQADAFYGDLILSFAGGVRYGSRVLSSTQGNGTNYCTLHCQAAPNTPTQTPTATATQAPTNTPVPPTSTRTNTPTNTPTLTPTNTVAGTPTRTPTNTPTNTPTTTPPSFCTGNLLQNGSFEIVSGTNSIGNPIPTIWVLENGEAGATTAFHPPDGRYVGYVWGIGSGHTGIWSQQVGAVAGNTYAMTFYSGTHDPSKNPSIEIRFYNSSNVEIGMPAIHTITTDIDITGSLGGPYTLSATAPAAVSYLKVIFRDPSTTRAGAKGDAVCLRPFTPTPTTTPTLMKTPTWTPTPTATATRTSTIAPTVVPTATPSRAPTNTPTMQRTSTPTKTGTPVRTPTPTPSLTPTPTGTPTATPTPMPLCQLIRSPGFWKHYDNYMTTSQFRSILNATPDYSHVSVAEAVGILANTADQYHRQLLSAELSAAWNGDLVSPRPGGELGSATYKNSALPGSSLNGMTVDAINHLAFTTNPSSARADLITYLEFLGGGGESYTGDQCRVTS